MKTIHAKNLELSKAAFELVKDRIPPVAAEDIREYIYDYNEWGLGVETLVDVLLEEDIAVSKSQRDAIFSAMDAMGLDRSQYELRVLE